MPGTQAVSRHLIDRVTTVVFDGASMPPRTQRYAHTLHVKSLIRGRRQWRGETERPSAAWNVPTSGARGSSPQSRGFVHVDNVKSRSPPARARHSSLAGEMLATEPLKGTDTEPADVIHFRAVT